VSGVRAPGAQDALVEAPRPPQQPAQRSTRTPPSATPLLPLPFGQCPWITVGFDRQCGQAYALVDLPKGDANIRVHAIGLRQLGQHGQCITKPLEIDEHRDLSLHNVQIRRIKPPGFRQMRQGRLVTAAHPLNMCQPAQQRNGWTIRCQFPGEHIRGFSKVILIDQLLYALQHDAGSAVLLDQAPDGTTRVTGEGLGGGVDRDGHQA
jgi:hypothetical protein